MNIKTFNMPSWLVLVLGLAGGVLEFLNSATFAWAPGSVWKQVITYGLIALGVFLISPLVGSQWKNALVTVLHLSPAVAGVISVIGTLIAGAVNTFSGLDSTAKGILLGVVAFLQFVGFGPASVGDLAKRAGYISQS